MTRDKTSVLRLYGMDSNGRGGYADCGNSASFNLTKTITIEAWIYPTENDKWSMIANKWNKKGYFLGILPDGGGLRLSINQTDGQCTSNPIEFYNWMHVAGTYDGEEIKLYQNGNQIAHREFSGAIPETNVPFQMSKQSNSNSWGFFSGSLADIRLWNYARTQAEIQASMSHRLVGNESGLVGYWPLNEGSGKTAHDKSQNSNHATLVGARWGESLGLSLANPTVSSEHDAGVSHLASENIFSLSVASGDPTESGVILWTRVSPKYYISDADLKYEVSNRDNFSSILAEGSVSDFGPERDYTAYLDLDDKEKLESDQRYYYRFIYRGVTSQTGRFKTLPSAEATPGSLSLAVLTCNDYSSGYFNAFHHLAKENIDFVVHLGDFAYEYPEYPPGYGKPYRAGLELDDQIGSTEKGFRASSLRDFRKIYQTYRQEPALQAAMEKHTWMIMLDDHEIADDAYWDYELKTFGANPDHPVYQEAYENYYKAQNIEPDKATEEEKQAAKEAVIAVVKPKMLQLYQDAMQAWTEYVPARWEKVTADSAKDNNEHKKLYDLRGEHYKLYRNFRFGNLVDFYLTDSRTYRDRPEGEEGTPWNPVSWRNTSKNNKMLEAMTDEKARNPKKAVVDLVKEVRKEVNADKVPDEWQWSMLGPVQKEWLIDGITKQETQPSQETQPPWKVWGNQTLLATSTIIEAQAHDDWHGFKAERYEILQRIKDSMKDKKTSRFVVFTGDMHTSLVSYLKTSFEEDFDPFESQWSWNPLDLIENSMNWSYPKLVGVEFMTPSVTAPGIVEGLLPGIESAIASKGGSLTSLVDAGLLGVPSAAYNTAAAVGSAAADTVTAVGSSLFGLVKNTASAATFGVLDSTANSIVDAAEAVADGAVDVVGAAVDVVTPDSKYTVGALIKAFSPHIEHLDPHVNGYAVAEFTPDDMTWTVYNIDKTKSDPDGKKEKVQAMKYDPKGIKLQNI